MDRFLDDMARALGQPVPRRKAFKSIAALLGGAFLAAMSPAKASAAPGNCTTCQNNGECTSNNCVSCGAGGNKICCPSGFVCCGTNRCCVSTACCDTGTGNCRTSAQQAGCGNGSAC
jgi:hypothetical protein